MAKRDVLVVGNYTHDTLIHSDAAPPAEALGGSSSYISSVLNSLSIDYAVVAKTGSDFNYTTKVRHKPIVAPASLTTRFIADFRQGERVLRVGASCAAIRPEDLRDTCNVAMACGVLDEILPETLLALSERSEHLVCDIQGLIRVAHPDGRLSHRALSETLHAAHIARVGYLKVSRSEAEFIDIQHVRNQTTVLLTEGEDGCTVLEREREFHVPAPKTVEVDPTGAGDCFLAGFACGLLGGLPLEKCVVLANRCGAMAVTQMGVPELDSKLKKWPRSWK